MFRRAVLHHMPKGTPYISSKDLRKTFATLLEIDLGANETAVGFYLGHAGVGVGHQHYTARGLESMRREVAERVEGWVQAISLQHGTQNTLPDVLENGCP